MDFIGDELFKLLCCVNVMCNCHTLLMKLHTAAGMYGYSN